MNLNLTEAEQEFLLELLEARHTSMLHELHHTDTYNYRQLLQQKVDLLERLRERLKNIASMSTVK
jgi:hypothetical protein